MASDGYVHADINAPARHLRGRASSPPGDKNLRRHAYALPVLLVAALAMALVVAMPLSRQAASSSLGIAKTDGLRVALITNDDSFTHRYRLSYTTDEGRVITQVLAIAARGARVIPLDGQASEYRGNPVPLTLRSISVKDLTTRTSYGPVPVRRARP